MNLHDNTTVNSRTMQILLVEDERDIRRFVQTVLRSENYSVAEADSVKRAHDITADSEPALVILDLGLPDGDGVQFVRDFRHWSAAPVLVLSARTAEQEKIAALDAGADDYLTKPFAVGELLARVRALLRRRAGTAPSSTAHIHFGDIEVDLARRRVLRAGENVHLTPIEYRLLALLIGNVGKVLTHRFLLREIWGPSYIDSNHYLRIYVGHLRQKLENDPAQPQHFITETAIGYRFQL